MAAVTALVPVTQRVVAVIIVTLIFVTWPTPLVAADIDFNRDIRPILSDKCYHCHGPDRNTQEADLRLDTQKGAADVVESGELVERILSDDPDYQMPPPDSKLSLTDSNKQTLRRWIESGANYKGHWAFELLPGSVPLPQVSQDDWCRRPWDRFVLEGILAAGLQPTKEAPPLRWLRRVTLDLTGLPPTATAIQNFEKRLANSGDRESVYAMTVDQLLDLRSFGEHMAVSWLDVARYADSYGYQSDKLNTQWPYRDWVVNAINRNLAYDEFLTWQLAGDLLDSPTREQRVATAFNRIHRLNNEGGAVFEEWRIENVADRVHTFGTAILGLTLECCRCHDHKYDSLLTRDYYSLSAFFNSIDESGVYDRRQKVPCPSILLPTGEQELAYQTTRENLLAAEGGWNESRSTATERFAVWKSRHKETGPEIPDLQIALAFDRAYDNSLKEIYYPSESDRNWTSMLDQVEVRDSPIWPLDPELAADRIELAPGEDPSTARFALKLDGERGVTILGVEPLDRWTPFTFVVTLRETKRVPQRSLIAHHTRGTDCGYNGWDLTVVDGYLESRMYRVWPGNAIGVRSRQPIPADRWHQIAATYDGSSKAHGLKLYLNGVPLDVEVLRDDVKKSANVVVDHGGEFVLGQRFRARGLAGGLIDDARLYKRELSTLELNYLMSGEWQFATLDYFVSAIDSQCRKAMKTLTEARKAFVMAEEVMDEIPVMEEMRTPRPAHVLARGQYDAATDSSTLVAREVPIALALPFPKDQPRDRLGLARWVTDPRHPLTARVAVNRLWGNFFTEPLVRTPENFGSQGALPTHPELLDWLARDLIDNDWDVKRFCRNVVLSATYRQDSVASPAILDVDPTNRLLARGPAHRLTAEQIRDLALAASGLLNAEVGGPPVSPYQPGEDLWRESNGMSPSYQQSVGKSLYRRSLYSVWKRTAPLPNMIAFDATPREVCNVKRARTNTPLQALVLLNDVQFLEASRRLAERVLQSAEGDEERIKVAFVALASRSPDDRELATLRSLLLEEREWFRSHNREAEQMVRHGESDLQSDRDLRDLAAMMTICQTILNLDATIWKR